jgi:hypothetical protein
VANFFQEQIPDWPSPKKRQDALGNGQSLNYPTNENKEFRKKFSRMYILIVHNVTLGEHSSIHETQRKLNQVTTLGEHYSKCGTK